MADRLIVESKVREFVKAQGDDMRVGGDFVEQLNTEVEKFVVKAIKRAQGNGRKTLHPVDC